jgi:hypothetical protein
MRLSTAPLAATLAAALLASCAALHRLDNDVSAWSRWPADRRPASYAFERLPSQQAQPQAQQLLEDAARPAIEAAGFTPASDASRADVTIQVGARITATDRSPFDDPYWWGPGLHRPYVFARGGRVFWGPSWRYGWGPPVDTYGYEREIALLIRDRQTGQPLYEARATSDGFSPMAETALPAMFRAALHDFPGGSAQNPHRVTVDLRPAPA